MIYNEIDLGIGNARLFIYKPNNAKENPAMLVLPGGGYGALCTEREGEPVAHAFMAKGFTAFVLHYSVYPQTKNSNPIAEASAAIAYIRRNADELGVDKNKVYVVGHSAGGHLCASLGILWHREDLVKEAGIEYGENKPNGIVCCYPVVSAFDHPHLESFHHLLANFEPSDEQLAYYSLERYVDDKSVPAFIIHTAEDTLVPVHNSIALARAYADNGIQFEFHIYPHGDHGFVLANEVTATEDGGFIDPQYARWVDDCIYFLRNLK